MTRIQAANNLFRATRALKYISLFIAGVAGFFFLGALREANISTVVAIVWTVSLCLGSLISLYGTLRRRWTGEYIGLPLVISCLILLAFSCTLGTITPVRVFLGMIFLGFAFSTSARRSDVKFQKRLADYDNRRQRGLVGL